MVGESRTIQQLQQIIARVAPRESTVLITGESGTGKELVAQAIHNNSPRRDRPFVAINCAAIADHLLESELFGHEKGAFTDARTQKKGKIELAEGGTVFLDEIGELAPRLQAKLLRVLQEREFSRVGGTDSIKVDIRLVAATNIDLETAIKAGTFRQDLYFRLNVVSVTTPPLRQRREDIPLLAAHFLKKYSKKCNREVLGISREALRALQQYDWPGNVRELENAIERAVVLGQTDRIVPDDLPEFLAEKTPPHTVTATRYNEAVLQLKKQLIVNAVEQSNGTYVRAAKALGLHPNYLHRLIREMGLKDELKRR
jgi:Nif-specific regulatory protein